LQPLFWVAVVLMAAVFAWELFGMRRPPDIVTPIREDLRVLRAAADSCKSALEADQLRFETFDDRLDSMRTRVRDLEAIDARGVPADSYSVYLGAFDRYNDSISGWTTRADTVRARWERCLAVTEEHNLLADSLRRILVRQLEESQRDRR
jgi:hypothetical protein